LGDGLVRGTLKEIEVPKEMSLSEALQRLDRSSLQIVLVVDQEGRLIGVVTDGDVRRALLKGTDLRIPVGDVMNSDPRVLPFGASMDEIRGLMQKASIRHIPIVDEDRRVLDLVTWEDLFVPCVKEHPEPVVIMAGGRGTRLDPFTKILPKPMIPIGDKPVVEMIMDKFSAQGFREFILCIGYKAEIIRAYFANDYGRAYKVEFVEESKPLGTAGALSILRGRINGTFLVSNCDVVVDLDASDVLSYHHAQGHMLTIIGALKDFVVPYGVLRTEGSAVRVDEKPSFHFLVSTGVYVLEPEVLEVVRPETETNMTDLIGLLEANGQSVGVYPYRGPWFDIGQWDEYSRSLRILEGIRDL
jgi:dTDP-glucose pyrophosphorylase